MIVKKLFRYFLLTIVLVQYAWSRPATENDLTNSWFAKSKEVCLKKTKYDQVDSDEKDGGSLSASLQLLKFTLNAFQNLALDSVKKAKTISENILRHADISSSQSPKILEFKNNLTQYEEKYSLCEGLENLFELVEVFTNTTEFYLESEEDTLDASDKLIANLLRKYGAEDMEKKAWTDMSEFVPKFSNKFVHLKEDLQKEGGAVAQQLLQWFKKFESLPNNEEKMEAFMEFFSLYEDEEDK